MPPTDLDARIDEAVRDLSSAFQDNPWFLQKHWPENEARVRKMLRDVAERFPPGSSAHVLDVGCFNGYVSYLFVRLGYRVTAVDMEAPRELERLRAGGNLRFVRVNLNELDALAELAPESFDAVVMGEIIEHVLNHPLGLMRSVARVLKPQGRLVLTTPNPATLMNAARLLLNRASLWGTPAFIEEPKIQGEQVICRADIHYREYLTHEMERMLASASFQVRRREFLPMGSSHDQPWAKRLIKRMPVLQPLLGTRLLGTCQYFVAERLPGA